MLLDERVRAALAAETRFGDIRLLDVTESTNQLVSELAAQGAPEGLVVAADWQSAGRGRLDRTWEARPGDGLLVSVLLRPAQLPVERWAVLTAAAALAAQDGCRQVAAVGAAIKWPNDLLAGGAKLAGILAEAASGAVVIGMGLNVHSGPPGSAHLDAAAGRRVGRAALLDAWLRNLDRRLRDLDAVARDYRARCETVGQQVVVDMARGERLEGVAEGIDDLGRLVVRTPQGGTRVVAVGDVTHLRPATGGC